VLDADREALALMVAIVNIKGTDDDFDSAENTPFLMGAGFGTTCTWAASRDWFQT